MGVGVGGGGFINGETKKLKRENMKNFPRRPTAVGVEKGPPTSIRRKKEL